MLRNRVARSPDEAQRNPGCVHVLPDYAASGSIRATILILCAP